MLPRHLEALTQDIVDYGVVCHSFSDDTTGWPASVRSIVSVLQQPASSPSTTRNDGCRDEPMSSLLLRLLEDPVLSSIPDGEEDARSLKEWFRACPRYSWKYVMSEIVKEAIPDAVTYHDCRFVRSVHGPMGPRCPEDEVYGTAASLIMVRVPQHVTPHEEIVGRDDGQEHMALARNHTPTWPLPDDYDVVGQATKHDVSDHSAERAETVEHDVFIEGHPASNPDVDSNQDGGDDVALDGTSEDLPLSEESPGEVEHSSYIQYPLNDFEEWESGHGSIETFLQSGLYDSLPSHHSHLHILATPFHPAPLVPILCVADGHNIVALMSSALSQRNALGLQLPVIGLLRPTTGSHVVFVVGWRDDSEACALSGISIALPMEGDSPSAGIFDLNDTQSLCAFVRVLQMVATHVAGELSSVCNDGEPIRSTAEHGWRADADDSFDDPWLADIMRWAQWAQRNSSTVQEGHLTMGTSEAGDSESWLLDRDLCAEGPTFDLQDPGIAAWSLDHHVLTVGLNPGGSVHAKFPSVLDVVYRSIGVYPCPGDDNHCLSTAVIGTVVAAMFRSDVDKPRDNAWLVWLAFINWRTQDAHRSTLDTLASVMHMPTIGLLRCLEYDKVVQCDQLQSYMPHRRMYHPTVAHKLLIQNDEESLLKASADPDGTVPQRYFPELSELTGVWTHMAQMHNTIFLQCFEDNSTSAMEFQTSELSERLTRYPLDGQLDAAICATDRGGFLAELAAATTRDFARDIAFFRDTADSDAFHLPVLLVRHQVSSLDLLSVTQNEQRLSCVSAAQFLAVLGIKDFPVYGLVTAGHYGYVSVAWCSKDNGFLYSADRNSARYRFDLSEKTGVARFIKFMTSVRNQTAKLQERFESVREELLTRVRTEEGRASLRWTLRSQVSQYSLGKHN